MAKMNLFGNGQNWFEKNGWVEDKEVGSKWGKTYRKWVEYGCADENGKRRKYEHTISFLKIGGEWVVQSYDRNVVDKNGIGNIGVALGEDEVRECWKEIKRLRKMERMSERMSERM